MNVPQDTEGMDSIGSVSKELYSIYDPSAMGVKESRDLGSQLLLCS